METYEVRRVLRVVCLEDVSQMFVISRFLVVLSPVVRLLSFNGQWFLWSVVLHRANTLLLEILVDLLIVHRVNGNAAPQLLKFFVDWKLRRFVVVENNFLLVQRTIYKYYLVLQVLEMFLAVRQTFLNILEQYTAQSLPILLFQESQQ